MLKLLSFYNENKLKLGVKVSEGVIDVEKAVNFFNKSLPTSLDNWLKAEEKVKEEFEEFIDTVREDQFLIAEDAINIGPCITNPSKIICVGLNYKKHAEEANMDVPEYPILFNKFPNTIASHEEEIFLPNNSQQVDYEAELGIIIGKVAKDVSVEDALDYVAGYCNVNDLSARDLQFRTNQWLLGKSLDGFCPVGPYLVTTEEVGDPNKLSIKTIVNGEERQYSNTSDMIFYCDEIVSYISNYMTLEPGDLILTGTPEGVISGYPEEKRVWLKDGDEITIKIEKLGELTNKMKAL